MLVRVVANLGLSCEEEESATRLIRKRLARVNDTVRCSGGVDNWLELSKKDPLDPCWGNDSGSCIAISEGNQHHFYGLPHNIADNATYIFDVKKGRRKEKRKNGKRVSKYDVKRSGSIFGFNAFDENDNLVMICNSEDLSLALTPLDIMEGLVEHIEMSLEEFGRQNGYSAVIVLDHPESFTRYFSKKRDNRVTGRFTKQSVSGEPRHYNDVFLPNGVSDEGHTFYTLYDDRKAA